MEAVEIALLPERPAVRKDAISELDLVVEIRCRSQKAQSRSAGPMNLCLVIDRSGSMQGDKIETAKKSCLDIFRRLGDGDLFTVVTFHSDVEVIVNPQTERVVIEPKINAIRAGGTTNLSLGWYQGLLELQTHMGESHHSRLLLLSDGMANQGETKRAVFVDTATQARDVGITASTVGIGNDYQEDLLDAIATSSGGRFWNIAESDIEDIIEEEFKGALTVMIDRPRVRLSLPDGVKVSRELNDLRKVSRTYRPRPLQGEDTFNFAVRLEIDPEQVAGESVTIRTSLLDGERDVAEGELDLALVSREGVATSPSHPLVRSVVQQYETTSSGEAMLERLDAGDMAAMREMLTAEIAKMRTVERDLERFRGDSRFEMEGLHVHNYGGMMTASEAISELIEPYARDREVMAFIALWRKNLRHADHRVKNRYHQVSPWDTEAPIVLEAIALADRLIARFPDDAARIEECRERLREYLEITS